MKGEFKNIVKVACIYVATIIGAGFASGQEIVQFFSIYYRGGFYGIILAGIMFSLIGGILLNKVYTERIRSYEEFLFPSVGYILGRIMEVLVALFMMSLFCIMLAGMGNIMEEGIGIPFGYAVPIMAIICGIIIMTDIKGIVSVSTVVSPVLISGIVIIGLYILICKDTAVFNSLNSMYTFTDNWVMSALLYVSYNSIISTVVMCGLLPYLKTRRVGIAGGILGGLLLCLVAFVLNSAIFIFYPSSITKEIPVLEIVEKYSGVLTRVYTFILWLAMLLSALTSGYCLVDRLKSKIKTRTVFLTAAMCAFSIPLANLGFSNLIAKLYPIFGYLGLFMVLVILLQGIKMPFSIRTGRVKVSQKIGK